MNLKRLLWTGVAAYFSAFVIGIVVAVLMNVDMTNAEIPPIIWYASAFVSIIITIPFALLYFRKVRPSTAEGLKLGFGYMVVGFLLDGVMALLGTLGGQDPTAMLDYYRQPMFWIAVALVIGTATAVGWWKASSIPITARQPKIRRKKLK